MMEEDLGRNRKEALRRYSLDAPGDVQHETPGTKAMNRLFVRNVQDRPSTEPKR